jgi:cell division protein FtsA
VDAHIITASSPSLRSLDQTLEKAEIAATHHTVSGLAAAEAVLTRQQKEAGTVLLDIGAGTTNLIVFEDGEVQHVAVIPIGGQHITNDLAIGLRTDLDIAEAVKVQQATLREGGARAATVNVKVGTKTHHFDSEEITMIAGARVEELLEYVNRELHKIKRAGKLPGGVVITGGTAKLPGIDDIARAHLELPARVGKLHNIGGLVDTVEDKSYTTVVGLMLLDMLLLPSLPPVHGGPKAGSKQARALLDGMFRRFKG